MEAPDGRLCDFEVWKAPLYVLGDKALEAPAAVTPKAGIDGLRYAMIAMLGMWFLLRRDLAGRYTGRG